MSRLFAVGDIHGCLKALETLAAEVPFRPDDVLVTLGDYVDRGPDSRGVLDWLIQRYDRGTLIPLRGNHDQMMAYAPSDPEMNNLWLSIGGVDTLRSYGTPDRIGTVKDVPARHWQFLRKDCRRFYETPTHIFVHAMLDADLPLEEQSDEILMWEKWSRFHPPRPHQSGKIMICGHTSQKNGWPLAVEHAVCIDTWVYGDGWLTCLEPRTGRFWQARQSGESRSGSLEDQTFF